MIAEKDIDTAAVVIVNFLDNNMGWLILLVFLIICRKAIVGLVERLTKFNFSWGNASGVVEAVAPSNDTGQNKQLESVADGSQPNIADSQPQELKEKEEKAKDWFPEMHSAFFAGEIDKAKQIFEEEQRKEKNTETRHSNEATFLYFMFTEGNDTSALPKLEELHVRAANDKQRTRSITWLSWCYDTTKDYTKEEELWLNGISAVSDESDKINFIIQLANVYVKKGEIEQGVDIIEKRLQEDNKPKQIALLYQALSNLEKERDDKEMSALALEKVVEFSPGNRDKLFEAAYAQSNSNLELLSLNNYRTLLTLNPRHGMASNNLGVCMREFKLKGQQISLYKKAVKEGNTLAMSNLANLYMNIGFWDEAKDILDEAIKHDEPHENVNNSIYQLQSLQTSEKDDLKSLNKKAQISQPLMREYAEACFDKASSPAEIEGVWFTEKGEEVIVEQTDNKVKVLWTEKQAVGIAGNINTFRVSLLGIRRNRSAVLTYSRRSEQDNTQAILTASPNISCYTYLTPDEQQWKIFPKKSEEKLEITFFRKK